MKRKILLVPLVLLLAISFVATGCPAAPPAAPPAPAPEEEVQHWKMQHFMGRGADPLSWGLLEGFCDDVRVMSQGLLDIELYSVGEICGLTETLDAVGADVLQMDHMFTNQWAGRNTAFEILGAYAFGLDDDEWIAWYGAGDGQKYADIVYHPYNVQAFPVFKHLNEVGGYSNFAIVSLADMQGKSYRMGAGMAQDILKEAGVNAMWLAGGECYGALDRGVVDILKWSGPAMNWGMKFHEVVSHIYYPGWCKPGEARMNEINLDRYNALPDHLKKILYSAGVMMGTKYFGKEQVMDAEYLQKYKDYGLIVTRLDDESLLELKRIATKLIAQLCDENPLFKEIYENQQEFIKGYREMKALTALPVE